MTFICKIRPVRKGFTVGNSYSSTRIGDRINLVDDDGLLVDISMAEFIDCFLVASPPPMEKIKASSTTDPILQELQEMKSQQAQIVKAIDRLMTMTCEILIGTKHAL